MPCSSCWTPRRSLAYLSLTPVHRRGWSSLYDALTAGTRDEAGLRDLLGGYPLDDGQPVYALDTSVWPRNDAATSPQRGHYFSPSRQSAGQPIVTGWSYSWLAHLSFTVVLGTVRRRGRSRVLGGGRLSAVAVHLLQVEDDRVVDGAVDSGQGRQGIFEDAFPVGEDQVDAAAAVSRSRVVECQQPPYARGPGGVITRRAGDGGDQ